MFNAFKKCILSLHFIVYLTETFKFVLAIRIEVESVFMDVFSVTVQPETSVQTTLMRLFQRHCPQLTWKEIERKDGD